MKTGMNADWPVLRTYDQDHLGRIALPLGGIGTGTVSLGGRGQLQDWEIVNRPAKGFAPRNCFFALYARPVGGQPVTRAIEGAIPPELYEGAFGCQAPNHGLPRFRRCNFAAAYPLAQVMLSDPAVPLDVRIEAFNPLAPPDAEASGIPAAVLRFVLTNRTGKPVAASVCGSMQNFIGYDGWRAPPGFCDSPNPATLMKLNRNRFRKSGSLCGVFMSSDRPDVELEQYGTMALATTARRGVSYRTGWLEATWGNSLLDFWDDFSADGRLERRRPGGSAPTASLAVSLTVPPGQSRSATFLIAWHYPNRYTWSPAGSSRDSSDRIGNYYTTRYRDAWDAAVKTAKDLPDLEKRTVRFVAALCGSDLPDEVKEAALFNLSTLRTQTCFRTPDGHLYGWEGCADHVGCCMGSCTHVWNYEQALPYLFGDLAADMRRVEFLHATGENGHMNFRVNLPLDRARPRGLAAADGQMGCLMKLYRDWRLSGDEQMLRDLWPAARRALEFCWIPGGWDADRDGVMEGCQHNTMDVEYYGPNPQMGTWYLGALRACEEMARHLGEDDFAATCRRLFVSGSSWMDENLFNGEYYEHQVRPPAGEADIAPGLRHGSMGARDLRRPELQLGAGCLVDQLVGQYMAHVCGLGYLLRPANVRKTLRGILRLNFRKDFHDHFNVNRSFVLNDEQAILMAAYPPGRRPAQPFPYYSEVMTGFEYVAAVGMIQEGLLAEGLRCIRAVRDRYDGLKRNPFDEAECGHHYARAMASWAAVLALTGFHYSGRDAEITFAAADRAGRTFWSTGRAWGTLAHRPLKQAVRVELTVHEGTLALNRLTLSAAGSLALPRLRRLTAGQSVKLTIPRT